MCFTALTTSEGSATEAARYEDAEVGMKGQRPDTDEREPVELDRETQDFPFFIFSEEDVLDSCERDL